MGLIAGPDSPPVTFASLGRRFQTSTDMAVKVLISDSISAPPSIAARAVTVTSSTLGESFTISGL